MIDPVLTLLKARFKPVRAASKGWYRVPCPTCTPKDRKKMKRYVHPSFNDTKCYICEIPLTFEDLTGVAKEKLPTSQRIVTIEEEHPQARILPYKSCIPLNELPEGHPALEFFLKDHLPYFDYYSSAYGICFVPYDAGIDIHFADTGTKIFTGETIVFPVHMRGVLVGWQCRFVPGTWHGDKMSWMRYFHIFQKGRALFNYDKAKQFKRVVVVEGIKKALKLQDAVATLGKGISDEQMQLIQEWKEIVLLLDSDEKTMKKAYELADEMRANGRTVVVIDLSKYGFPSPDEATSEQLIEIIEKEWACKDLTLSLR